MGNTEVRSNVDTLFVKLTGRIATRVVDAVRGVRQHERLAVRVSNACAFTNVFTVQLREQLKRRMRIRGYETSGDADTPEQRLLRRLRRR